MRSSTRDAHGRLRPLADVQAVVRQRSTRLVSGKEGRISRRGGGAKLALTFPLIAIVLR